MRAFLCRALLPLLVFAGGIASLVYGVGFHTATVAEEQEVEVPLLPPPGFVDPGLPFGGMPEAPAFPGTPGFPSKTKEKVVITVNEPESRLIREVTIGGVTRRGSGELWRTYRGEPPALCPT